LQARCVEVHSLPAQLLEGTLAGRMCVCALPNQLLAGTGSGTFVYHADRHIGLAMPGDVHVCVCAVASPKM
jgi:hypothetical protein